MARKSYLENDKFDINTINDSQNFDRMEDNNSLDAAGQRRLSADEFRDERVPELHQNYQRYVDRFDVHDCSHSYSGGHQVIDHTTSYESYNVNNNNNLIINPNVTQLPQQPMKRSFENDQNTCSGINQYHQNNLSQDHSHSHSSRIVASNVQSMNNSNPSTYRKNSRQKLFSRNWLYITCIAILALAIFITFSAVILYVILYINEGETEIGRKIFNNLAANSNTTLTQKSSLKVQNYDNSSRRKDTNRSKEKTDSPVKYAHRSDDKTKQFSSRSNETGTVITVYNDKNDIQNPEDHIIYDDHFEDQMNSKDNFDLEKSKTSMDDEVMVGKITNKNRKFESPTSISLEIEDLDLQNQIGNPDREMTIPDYPDYTDSYSSPSGPQRILITDPQVDPHVSTNTLYYVRKLNFDRRDVLLDVKASNFFHFSTNNEKFLVIAESSRNKVEIYKYDNTKKKFGIIQTLDYVHTFQMDPARDNIIRIDMHTLPDTSSLQGLLAQDVSSAIATPSSSDASHNSSLKNKTNKKLPNLLLISSTLNDLERQVKFFKFNTETLQFDLFDEEEQKPRRIIIKKSSDSGLKHSLSIERHFPIEDDLLDFKKLYHTKGRYHQQSLANSYKSKSSSAQEKESRQRNHEKINLSQNFNDESIRIEDLACLINPITHRLTVTLSKMNLDLKPMGKQRGQATVFCKLFQMKDVFLMLSLHQDKVGLRRAVITKFTKSVNPRTRKVEDYFDITSLAKKKVGRGVDVGELRFDFG